MKYIFRGHIVFEYDQDRKEVFQHEIKGIGIPAFDFCRWIPEDYRLLAEFFTIAHKHAIGEEVELKNFEVN